MVPDKALDPAAATKLNSVTKQGTSGITPRQSQQRRPECESPDRDHTHCSAVS